MFVRVEYEWQEVGRVERTLAGRLAFPEVPAAPGIYCFRVTHGGECEVYIGESANLRRRMTGNYATAHTGVTNVRVRAELLSDLTGGRAVAMAIVRSATIDVDGERSAADLTSKNTRVLIEHAAIAAARAAGCIVRNR